MGFKDYMNNSNNLSATAIADLQNEINIRERIANVFPLDVFHSNIKPFIHALTYYYDIPRSYVGLTLLSVYSTAIGTAYAVSTNGDDLFYLPVWGGIEGISSSGKSLAIDKILLPLLKIQEDFDFDWDRATYGLSAEKIKNMTLKKVIYRDAHIPTLVRDVLPDNPKGVLKYTDELMEWINGMNQLNRREGIDEQFWLSTWNCKSYQAIRAGKQTFNIPRPFVNVLGGFQPSLLPKLFANDRALTGFIFRVLFALPEVFKISNPNPAYLMPKEYSQIHNNSISELYKNLIVSDPYAKPKLCILSSDAIKLYQEWSNKLLREINQINDISKLEIESGIFGKIKEYVIRFCGLLRLSDLVLGKNKSDTISPEFFSYEIKIDEAIMERAIRLGDYFYESAGRAHAEASKKAIAPPDVLYWASLVKTGKSHREIASIIFKDDSPAGKQKVYRQIKKYSEDYPKVFGSIAKYCLSIKSV